MPPAIVQDVPSGTTHSLPSASAGPGQSGGVRFRISDQEPVAGLPTLDSAHVSGIGVVERSSEFEKVGERAIAAVRDFSEQLKSLPQGASQYQELHKKIGLVSKCLIAADVYAAESGERTVLPSHILRLEGAALTQFFNKELAHAVFSDQWSGYYAALYYDTSTQTFILANRGTSDLPDWANNVQQAVGLPAKQYDQAIALAKAVREAIDTCYNERVPLEFAGHSLGGGLASAQAVVLSECPAVTFNAAGVHRFTIDRQKVKLTQDTTQNITAYQVRGDILTVVQGGASSVFQGLVVPKAVGNPVVIAPEQQLPFFRPGQSMAQSIERHMMTEVLKQVLRHVGASE